MKTDFFEFNKGKLYFEVTGEGEPIVFVHGFTLDYRMWKPQVDEFSKKFKVITYDLRGFGKSSIPEDKYSHHEDLKALLDHLGISKTHVVGLSLGGEIALDFAVSYPSMVKILTLADSSLGGYKSTVDWNVHPELGLDKAKENWLNHQVFDKTRENENALTLLKQIVSDYSGWHWFNNDPREKVSPPAIDQIQNIKVPTLIMIGEYDLSYFKDIAVILNNKIPNSKKIIIKNSGHMSNLENIEQFNKTIEQQLG